MAVELRGHRIVAAILDTDGVVTDTASVHYEAWKQVFDEALRAWGGDTLPEPFTHREYLDHVDGVSRYEGVARWLRSRGIPLPYGSIDDAPGTSTVCAIGNAKNERFLVRLRREGAPRYEGSVRLLSWLREHDVPAAVISASRNAAEVLDAARVDEWFDARVDGVEAGRLGLAGKPEPDIFLEAARRLKASPSATMVVEDALQGVEAARRGGFGLVVGVDRADQRAALLSRGAHVVVEDLGELLDEREP